MTACIEVLCGVDKWQAVTSECLSNVWLKACTWLCLVSLPHFNTSCPTGTVCVTKLRVSGSPALLSHCLSGCIKKPQKDWRRTARVCGCCRFVINLMSAASRGERPWRKSIKASVEVGNDGGARFPQLCRLSLSNLCQAYLCFICWRLPEAPGPLNRYKQSGENV